MDEFVVLDKFTDDEERNRETMGLFSCLMLVDLEIIDVASCDRLWRAVELGNLFDRQRFLGS